MKPLTAEWVAKAEQDYRAAVLLGGVRGGSFGEVVCFHCQQSAEKNLKARLQEAAIEFPKTHDLLQLLKLVLPVEPLWESLREELKVLNEYAVEFRYPGDSVTPEEVRQALSMCRTVRQLARLSLGLEGNQPDLHVHEKKAIYRTRQRKQ